MNVKSWNIFKKEHKELEYQETHKWAKSEVYDNQTEPVYQDVVLKSTYRTDFITNAKNIFKALKQNYYVECPINEEIGPCALVSKRDDNPQELVVVITPMADIE